MDAVSPDVLHRPDPGDHLAQAYTDDRFLIGAVADYAGAGLQKGEAAIVIATSAHVALLARELTARGMDVAALLAARRLLVLDAAPTLGQFLSAGGLDRERFFAVVGGALDHVRAAGHHDVRLFGEMVDLLWAVDLEATLALERLWNEVLAAERVSLLCAYRLDPLDPQAHVVLRRVTHVHSHLLPGEDQPRFDEAVNRAYAEVFGVEGDARILRELMVSCQTVRTAMPRGQAALFAVADMPPFIAHDVRTRVHRHYRAGS
jgi:hypothetical protein